VLVKCCIRASSPLPEITYALDNWFAAAQQKNCLAMLCPNSVVSDKGLVKATVLIRAKFVFFVFLPKRASPLIQF